MFKPERTKVIKTLLVSCALIIAAGSLFVSNALIADLKSEEQARVGVWAEAMQSFMRADENTDLNLGTEVELSNNFGSVAGFKCRPCLGMKWVF